MSKKRRSEDSAEEKEKLPEFNGTVFKNMLKEPGTAMKGQYVYSTSHTSDASVSSLLCCG